MFVKSITDLYEFILWLRRKDISHVLILPSGVPLKDFRDVISLYLIFQKNLSNVLSNDIELHVLSFIYPLESSYLFCYLQSAPKIDVDLLDDDNDSFDPEIYRNRKQALLIKQEGEREIFYRSVYHLVEEPYLGTSKLEGICTKEVNLNQVKLFLEKDILERNENWKRNAIKIFFLLFKKRFIRNTLFRIDAYLDGKRLYWFINKYIEEDIESMPRRIRITFSLKQPFDLFFEINIFIGDGRTFIVEYLLKLNSKNLLTPEDFLMSRKEFLKTRLLTDSSEIFDEIMKHLDVLNEEVFKKFKIFGKYVESLKLNKLFIKYRNFKTLLTNIKERYTNCKISFFPDAGFFLSYSNNKESKHITFSIDSDKVYVYSSSNSSLGEIISDDTCLFEGNPVISDSSLTRNIPMEKIMRLVF
jgi:hypothetical protein